MQLIERHGKFMINVAVFGYGTVGSGVVEVINDNAELISKRVCVCS